MSTLLLLLACSGSKTEDSSQATDSQATNTAPLDSDGDGVPDSADCDPADPYAYPGAHEVPYDGKDQDCDGADVTDADGDGYDGVGGGGDDCNDNNPNVHPGAEEICYNGQDDDCDGTAEQTNDCDGDGYLLGSDCDDENPSIHPDAEDAWYDGIDSDCNRDNDYDQDKDGEEWDGNGGPDCDDQNSAINTDATEEWDGIDNDCDTSVDNETNRTAYTSYYESGASADDGFGSAFATLGDIDRDGRPDIAIGANATNGDMGRIWILPVEKGVVQQELTALAEIEGDTGTAFGGTLLHLDEYLITGGADAANSIYGYPVVFSLSSLSGAMSESMGSLLQLNSGASVMITLPDLDGDGHRELVSTIPGVAAEVDLVTYAHLMGGVADWTIGTGGAELILGMGVVADQDGDGLEDLGLLYQARIGNKLAVQPSSGIQVGSAGDLSTLQNKGFIGDINHWAVLPDINGDGYEESLLSSQTAESGAGRVYLISGELGDVTSTAFATVTGSVVDANIWSEQLLDADSNGTDELLVCAPGTLTAGLNGSCTTLPVADLAAGGDHLVGTSIPSFQSRSVNDLFGTAALAEDFDADGDDDLWVSLPGTGSVVLFRQE